MGVAPTIAVNHHLSSSSYLISDVDNGCFRHSGAGACGPVGNLHLPVTL